MNVLIAEDEFLVGLLLAEFLADAGHCVLGPATTLPEALTLLRPTPLDLALVDIELRDGDTGLALAAALQRAAVPSIFVSAQSALARSHRRHAIGYISKPYTPTLVVETVRWFEALRGGTSPLRSPPFFEPFEGARELIARARAVSAVG
jgi:two-component system, response regulator PdtaR